jgi:feruloyl-CoA synthase
MGLGAFVACGEVRLSATGAIGPAVTDQVVCGEDQAGVGLLLYPNPTWAREAVAAAARTGIEAFNRRTPRVAGRIARARVLAQPPDPASGEITDKGYVSQSIARARHAAVIDDLFAERPDAEVMVFG